MGFFMFVSLILSVFRHSTFIHLIPMFELRRNQSIDLQGSLTDWFLYDDKVNL